GQVAALDDGCRQALALGVELPHTSPERLLLGVPRLGPGLEVGPRRSAGFPGRGRYKRVPRRCGGLARLGKRGVRNAEVEGSNPLPSTIKTSVHLGDVFWERDALGALPLVSSRDAGSCRHPPTRR